MAFRELTSSLYNVRTVVYTTRRMHKNYEKSNLNNSRKEETGWDGVLKIPLQYDICQITFELWVEE